MAKPRTRPFCSGDAPIGSLLAAERFRLGPKTARVRANLSDVGGTIDEQATAWVGADLPPLGAPSITLGAARGTLGPYSFGFLDNHRAIAPYAAPLALRPRAGRIAFLCGRREALPDIAPLAAARDIGVAWIISVGDGDATDAIVHLAADPNTGAVLLAARADPQAIAATGGKPIVLLGGDPLLRAAVRRTGGTTVDDLELWLAHASLLDCGAPIERPLALIAGGGASRLAEAARAAGLELPILQLDEDDAEAAFAEVGARSDLLLIAGLPRPPTPRSLTIDVGHADRVRALCAALKALREPAQPPIPRVRADRPRALEILDAAGAELADHDAKRVLKCFGARVSRQAPAASPTAALRIGQQVGFPVDILSSRGERRAASVAELRHATALLLGGEPFVLVREAYPPSPRCHLQIRRERGLGLLAEVGGERALLPLERSEAIVLARAAAGQVDRALVDLLARAAATAVDLALCFDLELYVGESPTVIAAKAWR